MITILLLTLLIELMLASIEYNRRQRLNRRQEYSRKLHAACNRGQRIRIS